MRLRSGPLVGNNGRVATTLVRSGGMSCNGESCQLLEGSTCGEQTLDSCASTLSLV